MSQWILRRLLWLTSAFIAVVVGILPAFAEDTTNCKIHNWTTENGLPQNRIACLQQTRDGYLWIGTWFGLARFDGTQFRVFNKENTSAFVDDAVSSLAEDSEGVLWIGTKEGLLKYEHGTFHRFTTADGLPHSDIWRLVSSPEGELWLESGNEIVQLFQNKFAKIWKCADGERIRNLDKGIRGGLDVFLTHAWIEINEKGIVATNYQEPDIQPLFPGGGRFWSGIIETDGAALISTTSGLLRVRGDNAGKAVIDEFAGAVGLLTRENSGEIWAQAQKRFVTCLTGTNQVNFDLGKYASDLICATKDSQGNLWLGTEDGLVQLEFPKVKSFSTRQGLPHDNVVTVCEGPDRRTWIGTDGGLVSVRSNHVESAPVSGMDINQRIQCVWPARDGGLWLAAYDDGIFHINNDHASAMGKIGLPVSLFEDHSDRLWIGTAGGPISLYQNGRWQSLPSELISLRDVHSIFQDRIGCLWFGTTNRLTLWNGTHISTFDTHNGSPVGYIWSILDDEDGALWLGTENGLVRFAHGKFFQFTTKQNMPKGTVNCVLNDESGCFWFSTLNGIYRVTRKELDAVADGKAEEIQPFVISIVDGMSSAECNGEVQPAGWRAHDGRLWFATSKGVAVADPKDFLKKENPAPALFESMKADGKELFHSRAEKIKIAAGCGHALDFHFTACDLTAPEKVRFKMRLEGADENWSELTANRSVSYFNLSPGDYRLQVKATDHHGHESVPSVLEFTIAPYFWQTMWFYVLCGGGIIGIAAAVQAYRLRWQHRLLKIEQQRALASERTRIARDLHDDLGTALTGVALELDVLGREANSHNSVIERLARSSQHVRHLAGRMREVVWAINPQCDNLRSLVDFTEDQAGLLLRAAGLKVRLELPLEVPDLTVDAHVRHQIALAVREAFANVVRHAHASEADIRLELSDEDLMFRVRDNGRGFQPQSHLEKQHGLLNMSKRMEQIGGKFECKSAPGDGTSITLSVPLSRLKSLSENI